MARNKRKYVRRIIMINKPLQARLILAMSLFPTLGLAATTILVSYFSHRLYEEASLAAL